MDNATLYQTFWTELRAKANPQVAPPVHSKSPKEWLLSIQSAGFTYFYALRVHDAYVELWIKLSTPEENEALYQHLLEHRADIENAVGGHLRWNPKKSPPKNTRCIQLAVPGGCGDDRCDGLFSTTLSSRL